MSRAGNAVVQGATGTLAATSHVPLAALRLMSLLAKPMAPAFARQTHAAVVMNTTDMTAGIADKPISNHQIERLLSGHDDDGDGDGSSSSEPIG